MLILFYLIISIVFQNQLIIDNPWIRSASKGMTTAAFMEIKNPDDLPDTLYKVKSGCAKIVEIHETYTEGDMMGMRAVNMLVVPAKSSLILKPKSFHIMLIKLKKNLNENASEELSLFFKRKGEIKIKAKIIQ